MISMSRLVYYLIDHSFRIYELIVIIEYYWKLRLGIVETVTTRNPHNRVHDGA